MRRNRLSPSNQSLGDGVGEESARIGDVFESSNTHSLVFRLMRLIRVRTHMTLLSCHNLLSRKPLTGVANCDVSLTTHGHRIHLVHHSIESIGRGKSRPQRIVLWIDDAALYNNLPTPLRRLQKRGLEIKLTKNYGPHTKYYPYVKKRIVPGQTPLVTADDDILYPRHWLKCLLDRHHNDPKSVWCYRAHRLSFADGRLLPYSDWTRVTSDHASYRNFATGVSGVIYPPSLLDALERAGELFQEAAPRADDIWLHAMAVRSGHRVRQVGSRSVDFDIVRGTWAGGLVGDNTTGGNDDQIRHTYTQDDIDRILADSE